MKEHTNTETQILQLLQLGENPSLEEIRDAYENMQSLKDTIGTEHETVYKMSLNELENTFFSKAETLAGQALENRQEKLSMLHSIRKLFDAFSESNVPLKRKVVSNINNRIYGLEYVLKQSEKNAP